MKFSDLQRSKMQSDPLARVRRQAESPPPVSFVPLGTLMFVPSGICLPMASRPQQTQLPDALPAHGVLA